MGEYVKGLGVVPKIGIGKAVVLAEYIERPVKSQINKREDEWERYCAAKLVFMEETDILEQRLQNSTQDTSVVSIIAGHNAIVDDIQFNDDVKMLIMENGVGADEAVHQVCGKYSEIFMNMENKVLKQRAADFEDIANRLIAIINSGTSKTNNALPYEQSVIVAKELHPSQMVSMNANNIEGVVLGRGGATAHVAVLAKALGIPVLIGVGEFVDIIKEGDYIVVDGKEGIACINPNSDELQEYISKQTQCSKDAEYSQLLNKPAVMKDGTSVQIQANVSSVDEAKKITGLNCDGIGLMRTEFVFMDREQLPSVEEQLHIYRDILDATAGKVITIRTLDIGGDKNVPYMGLDKEDNPYLGLRGIRLCLKREGILCNQIEAILRASAYKKGSVRIMIPMITEVEEVKTVKSIVKRVMEKLSQEGIDYDDSMKLGIMIETPAAVIMAKELAKEVDFFSIGTNDLTQYIMAADRGNDTVAYLYNSMSPAVLRSIKYVIDAADEADIEVSMCGEAASNPAMIPVLLGMGLRKFSVATSVLLETKSIIAHWDADTTSKIVEKLRV